MVIPQHQEFVRANSSSRHALLTFILGYHMYEWANGKRFKREDFVRKYPNDTDLVEVFEVARRIANGTKHFKAKTKTKVQIGFSSDFSDDFARPLNVTLPDGTEHSADNLLRRIVDFWQRQERCGAF